MPLKDSHFNRGKCGFKLIQYGGIGIPSVASDVGFNNKVIDNEKTGFLVGNEREWIDCLSKLIDDSNLRKKMGEDAYEKVSNAYSIDNTLPKLIKLFDTII